MGFEVGYFSDFHEDPFLRQPEILAKASPVFFEALKQSESEWVREIAAGTLTDFSHARNRKLLLERIIDAYQTEESERVRWLLCQSIERMTGKGMFDVIFPLIRDPLRNEDGQLIQALAKTGDQRAEEVMLVVLQRYLSEGDEDEDSLYAVDRSINGLGRLRSQAALPLVRKIAAVANADLAREAKKVLKRFDST